MDAGRVLAGRYRLVSKLGSGGMGTVWSAHDLHLNADVAVKLIDPKLMSSPEALVRFRREAQAAATIRSTHVVQIFDHGVDGQEPFIAMELLHGESLAERLTRVGRLPPEVTARLLGQVARALALAHQRNIVHRDMKPDNIYLVHEGDEDIAKVLDFGIARAQGLAEGGPAEVATRTGAVLGTPFYMSPEQANAHALDARTDIWAFGVIACECLTGRRPFSADTLAALFHAICMAPPPVPSSLGAVPEGFDAWFARATARNLGERYASIREAADDLKHVCLSVAVHAERASNSASPNVSTSSAGNVSTAGEVGTVTAVQLGTPDARPSHRLRNGIAAALFIVVVLGTGAAFRRYVASGVASGAEPRVTVASARDTERVENGVSSSAPSSALPINGDATASGAGEVPKPTTSTTEEPAPPTRPAPTRAATARAGANAVASSTAVPTPVGAPKPDRTGSKVAPAKRAPNPSPKRDDNASGI
ncbi:MAG TPA: serine/threonine-protein kinase [Polyangiaceae bacterium]|nr:serine/threonine-protein kinase [Polyangiaceae bacterium]